MNPDTNKFEQLGCKVSAEQAESELAGMKELLEREMTRGQLVRPDGSPVPKHWSVFAVDEHVVVKDYTFKVAHIGEGYMVFEPVGIPTLGEPEPPSDEP
jgi:hypothetical protein